MDYLGHLKNFCTPGEGTDIRRKDKRSPSGRPARCFSLEEGFLPCYLPLIAERLRTRPWGPIPFPYHFQSNQRSTALTKEQRVPLVLVERLDVLPRLRRDGARLLRRRRRRQPHPLHPARSSAVQAHHGGRLAEGPHRRGVAEGLPGGQPHRAPTGELQ